MLPAGPHLAPLQPYHHLHRIRGIHPLITNAATISTPIIAQRKIITATAAACANVNNRNGIKSLTLTLTLTLTQPSDFHQHAHRDPHEDKRGFRAPKIVSYNWAGTHRIRLCVRGLQLLHTTTSTTILITRRIITTVTANRGGKHQKHCQISTTSTHTEIRNGDRHLSEARSADPSIRGIHPIDPDRDETGDPNDG